MNNLYHRKCTLKSYWEWAGRISPRAWKYSEKTKSRNQRDKISSFNHSDYTGYHGAATGGTSENWKNVWEYFEGPEYIEKFIECPGKCIGPHPKLK